jgi:hypothetical protein
VLLALIIVIPLGVMLPRVSSGSVASLPSSVRAMRRARLERYARTPIGQLTPVPPRPQ